MFGLRARAISSAGNPSHHHVALLSTAVLSVASLSVLYHVVDVVGGVRPFLAIVAGSIGLAVVLRSVSRRTAVTLAATLLLGGLALYLLSMPEARLAQLSIDRLARDLVGLLTGYSVIELANVTNWVLAVTAPPTFLTWYFALRRNYVGAAAVGGLTIGFFVLTGDSGALGSLLGVLGAFGTIGFGTLDVHGAGWAHGELLVSVFALMLVGAGSVAAVPDSPSPIVPNDTKTASGDLVSAGDRVTVSGSISLSPQVLFTVDSQKPAYWRASVYDRFTGSSWIRTGPPGMEGQQASGPPGESTRIEHQVTAQRRIDVVPAASKPVRVSGESVTITEFGDLVAEGSLESGEQYSVVSERPVLDPVARERTDIEYPQAVRDRYRQVPSSTTDRVRTLGEEIAGEEESPYQKARAIERWLEANKAYSLEVQHPEGDVVDTFLFDRNRGYCVYYASAMVVLLRTQDVPARFVVGYTPGQHVGDDDWVVRGLDSHAWVEVYLPDVGWVQFDPTPGEPRQAVEHERIQRAREAGEDGVDALGSAEETLSDVDESTTGVPDESDGSHGNDSQQSQDLPEFQNGSRVTTNESTGAFNESIPALDESPGQGSNGAPTRAIGFWGISLVAIAIGVRRTHLHTRAYRYVWFRRLPSGDPERVVEGVFERVTYSLASRHRSRRPGETVREYVDDVAEDDRVDTIVHLRERARYAGDVDATDAELARDTFRDLLDDDAGSRFSASTVFNRLLS
ncbi:MAG: transglutaminase TgpA family protein [Halodesulfurarchaeum sp.]